MTYPLVNVNSLRTGKWPSRNNGSTQLQNAGSFQFVVCKHIPVTYMVYGLWFMANMGMDQYL